MPPETELAAEIGPMTPRMYRVTERREEQRDTVTVDLAPVTDVVSLPAAGQFNMVWAFGIGEAPISLSGIEDEILTHTIRRVGAVTTALCAAQTGDQLGVRGPFGTGWELTRAAGRDILVVAGGVGLAPLRPLISELLDQRADYGRATVLVGARTPETLLFWDELQQWRARLDIDVKVTVDMATPSWRDDVGVVTRLIDQADIDPVSTTAFVCGPEVMMRFAAQAIVRCGVPSAGVKVSLERNMRCAIGHCGHCQLGPEFICKDGPVMAWSRVEHLLRVRER